MNALGFHYLLSAETNSMRNEAVSVPADETSTTSFASHVLLVLHCTLRASMPDATLIASKYV